MDKTQIAVSIFNKYASEYQNKFMDVNLYSDSLDLFCKKITKQKASVLELACGPGNITKYLLDKRPDLKILGTDLAPRMIKLARQNNPAAEFKILDCRNISVFEKKFDAIICGFCFPYLNKNEALKLISDASELLKPNGVIYISTMEDDYDNSGFKKGSSGEEIFMYYYTADDLTGMLEKNNFKIAELQRKESTAPDGTTVIDLIILAVKLP
ncbi:MAG TPA: class I SAM-dependent methyltransferase [Bacteroidia bacterium]|jgi:ubiquinone/menaquinone biosynthesis C-methylase UbiE|nr:class I SAM-dependent methyltransferase [Bacteroidia bacterium]